MHETGCSEAARGRGPKFPADTDGFLRELRRRAADHFGSADREQGGGRMYLKAAVILGWTAAAYGLLVFAATAWWQAVPLAVALGLGLAAVAFNLAHDGGHSAVSRRRWVNRLAAGTLDLVGASSYLWRLKHGIHHTYANVPGHDTDIDLGRLMRLCPTQPRHWFHRWQHLYLWPLYGLSAARWHLYSDFQEVAAGRIGPHPIRRPRGWDLAVFVGGKAVSIGLLLGLPLALHPWWVVLPGYLLVTVGLALLASSFVSMDLVEPLSPLWLLVALSILGRVGLGFILPSLNIGAMRGLPKPMIAQGASVINFVRTLGGAAGVSLCGIALEWRLQVHGDRLSNPVTTQARLDAFGEVFWMLGLTCALAILASWKLREPG
jgi:hypothetical protein